ncbi:MAG: molybdenum cofactor biosynthesis protein MoaE [Actinobacteria bacterium]|nr:molybdenum cofactor biosynthesis protein MoaE [Actinomycetota bacterium]
MITAVTADPLDVAALIGQASSPEAGGLGIFVGTVRTSAAVPGKKEAPVVRLEYEAHPALAEERLTSIAEDAAKKWPLERVVAVHRSGACDVGEPTVVVVCAAPHRGDALEACRHVIDTIKETVPIWKREVYADGSSWVGAEGR